MDGMRILVIGSGGREHALLTGLKADPFVTDLHIAPGSPAHTQQATVHPEYSQVDDPVRMVELALDIAADLVVIGPEVPLVNGVTDALRERGVAVFGPSASAAQIEGSKAFAKDVMAAAGVRTARAEQLAPSTAGADIEAALDRFGPHFVVKDDGLAGGKGVVVTESREEARAHVDAVHAAGNPVLLESFLDGPEVSLFCLVDGETVVPLLPAQDHKRAYDNDEGPNTGGMGAYAPLPWLPEDGVQTIVDIIARPVAEEMVRRGTPYRGLLYIGAAWGPQGPAVVEFNARFGDPETQAVLSLLQTPLADVLLAVAQGRLGEVGELQWRDGFAAMVVLAAEGYPQAAKTGGVVSGEALDDPSRVLHAGTKEENGEYVAAGGRVLGVVGQGATLEDAVAQAYQIIEGIELPGAFYRKDIARPAIEGAISL